MGTLDGGLVSVDADTGRACEDFGDNGRVDIHQGLGPLNEARVRITSFPVVAGDLVISGHMVADYSGYDVPGGVIRAWDVRSGELRWAFDPVAPGTPPLPANDDGSPNFHRATANAWSILTVDRERNLVFVPFGSANMDYYGVPKHSMPAGVEYYANTLVALDALSGEVKWRFKAVHYDLWDFDVSAQPALIDVWKDGEKIPAVAQGTKMGFIFLLHRETGEPIYPLDYREVPQTNVPGERTAATQPFPTFPEPLQTRQVSEDDVFGFTFYDKEYCREKIRNSRNEGIYTPPGYQRDAIHFPGQAGGVNWGGMAWHPDEQIVVVNQNFVATLRGIVTKEGIDPDVPEWRRAPLADSEYYLRGELFLSPFGVPCIKPPWGTLVAVSLKSGKKIWEIPFGTTRDMVPGLSVLPFGLNYGLPSAGGPVITASGLVFIGAALDNYIRAYDMNSGEELWRERLPAGAQATPMTYRLAKNGRQYVVIAAGGHDAMRTKTGDSLIAFALPEKQGK
jgi:quinoprotein glucose dehydrogenase